MKKLIVLVIALHSLNLCFGQLDIVDMAKVKVEYKYIFYPDSNRTTGVRTSDMVLLVGESISQFSEVVRVLCDSLLHYYPEDKTIFVKMNDFYNSYNNHTFSFFYIYKNFPKAGEVYFIKTWGSQRRFAVIDSERISWELDSKSDTVILGYRCRKAYTAFRGRHYMAWYTSEIPINDGPYKFRGLPGLILLVYDNQNLHRFEAQSIKECSPRSPIFMKDLSRYREVTPKEFVDIFYSENMNFLNKLLNGDYNYMITKERQAELIKRNKSWNNYIEKF